MIIRDIFKEDIQRKINGVVQVVQSEESIVALELKEYVITKELKKHFMTFFNNYGDAFDEPTNDIGVWISGFFGSGKSHFLKTLSYLLENREVAGIRSVERFRQKFQDDPATYMLIDRATKVPTETILFNIGSESSINKDKTAVLRAFAKMFYTHLGFGGENLKMALMEQYIDQQGKTDEFRRAFEEKKGKSWLECRRAFAFHGKAIVPAMAQALDMSEEDAQAWFSDKSPIEYSISRFAQDVKAYVDTKPANFRLLFMVDEVGQYVGTDVELLLNLQSIVEELGRVCRGQVWVVCTGQEAIDEIIKVRTDEFSRIQARFKTRLSLSSSSVDEVVQERILKKKPEAHKQLEQVYDRNDSVLRNLFTFTNAVKDLKGYSGPKEFADDFPFVPYQFIIMQKVFNEIRKHGNAGKHQSNGERSMLDGFQISAKSIMEKDEYALVPFSSFYDTVHAFLDSTIRRVIERCRNAADCGDGIELQDVTVLKLLYLIRYIGNDIPANLDNIVILMADDIRMDKIEMREKILGSLNRLLSQNYIGRTGDTYNFLTDEEQEVQRDIEKEQVDTSDIVSKIGQKIFGDIYTSKKYTYGKYNFAFDRMVDGIAFGSTTGNMRLHFLTVATDISEKSELQLLAQSKGNEAIVVLADTPYYSLLEKSEQIQKYQKRQSGKQITKSVRDIIRRYQDQGMQYDAEAKEELEKAIESAQFYVDGEHIENKGKGIKEKLDQAMEYLVAHVYSEIGLIDRNFTSDAEISAILNGTDTMLPGEEPNQAAAARIEEYLDMQNTRRMPTSMADIQSRYQAVPYGWREIDISAVVARLIYNQKVTIKYAGETIQPDNAKLPDMLRKKSEVGKTGISKRQIIEARKIRQAKQILRDYFGLMDVPDNENGLVSFITEHFTQQKNHYEELLARYEGHHYPDKEQVEEAVQQLNKVLIQRRDNTALIDALLKNENELFDSKDSVQKVEGFFRSQVQIFDAAVRLEEKLKHDLSYFAQEDEAQEALNQIRLITGVQTSSRTVYLRIPELNKLMDVVRASHDHLLGNKRRDLLEMVRQCMEEIHTLAGRNPTACQSVAEKADAFFDRQKEQIAELDSLALLDGLIPQIWNYKDEACSRMENVNSGAKQEPADRKVVRSVYRQVAFPSRRLESQEDIEAYLENAREYLMRMIQDCDGIQLQ